MDDLDVLYANQASKAIPSDRPPIGIPVLDDDDDGLLLFIYMASFEAHCGAALSINSRSFIAQLAFCVYYVLYVYGKLPTTYTGGVGH